MRLFIALNPSDQERERLYRATAPLRRAGLPVRWVPPESIHLTLKFLGEVRPEHVEQVAHATAVAAGKSGAFEAEIGGFGAFPTLRKPRVLWLGVRATPELRCLKHDVEWELARLGYEREVRAFMPHLTLARALGNPGAGEFRHLEALLSKVTFSGVLQAESVDLMRSHTTPEGSRYEAIRRFPLRTATRSVASG